MSAPRPTPEPTLSFTGRAWRKLDLFTTLCPFEIGGLGTVNARGLDFEVDDIFLVPQDVNDIATRLDGDGVSALIERLLGEGRDPGRLRLWWHSHAREATFWSGEDEETISGFRNDTMISLVTNHQLRLLARIDSYAPRTTTWVHVERPAGGPEPTADETDAARGTIADAVRYIPAPRRERVL